MNRTLATLVGISILACAAACGSTVADPPGAPDSAGDGGDVAPGETPASSPLPGDDGTTNGANGTNGTGTGAGSSGTSASADGGTGGANAGGDAGSGGTCCLFDGCYTCPSADALTKCIGDDVGACLNACAFGDVDCTLACLGSTSTAAPDPSACTKK